MKQYETIKMTPKKAVYTVLRGKDKCTPEVWKSAEQMLRTMAEASTPKKPYLEEYVDEYYYRYCPNCDALFAVDEIEDSEYCRHCGQAIKW